MRPRAAYHPADPPTARADVAPRSMIPGDTRRRAPATRSVPPTAAMRAPIVLTSQRSRFGPVTASKLRRWTIGQTPVTPQYAPWASASPRVSRLMARRCARRAKGGERSAPRGSAPLDPRARAEIDGVVGELADPARPRDRLRLEQRHRERPA